VIGSEKCHRRALQLLGRPFSFPDGIKSLEITVNPANGVTVKINE